MTAADNAALRLLARTAEAIASVNGPISSGTAAAALMAVVSVIRSRNRPISMQTLDGIVALIEAVRDDITS